MCGRQRKKKDKRRICGISRIAFSGRMHVRARQLSSGLNDDVLPNDKDVENAELTGKGSPMAH